MTSEADLIMMRAVMLQAHSQHYITPTSMQGLLGCSRKTCMGSEREVTYKHGPQEHVEYPLQAPHSGHYHDFCRKSVEQSLCNLLHAGRGVWLALMHGAGEWVCHMGGWG